MENKNWTYMIKSRITKELSAQAVSSWWNYKIYTDYVRMIITTLVICIVLLLARYRIAQSCIYTDMMAASILLTENLIAWTKWFVLIVLLVFPYMEYRKRKLIKAEEKIIEEMPEECCNAMVIDNSCIKIKNNITNVVKEIGWEDIKFAIVYDKAIVLVLPKYAITINREDMTPQYLNDLLIQIKSNVRVKHSKKYKYPVVISILCLSLIAVFAFCVKFSNTKEADYIVEQNIEVKKTEYLTEHCTSDAILDNCLSLLGEEIEPIEIQFQSGEQIKTGSGKIIVELMNINCQHCNGNMPYVLEAKDETNIPIYTCTYADDPIAVEEWQAQNGYDFDMGFVSYDLVKYDLGLKYTPCFLFLDNNKVSFVYIGDIYSADELLAMIEVSYE